MITGIHISGADDLVKKLDSLANSMYDFGDPLEDIGEYWRAQVARQFQLRGALPGIRGPWRKLSPFTVEKKGHNTPLVDTADMETSYIDPWDRYAVEDIWDDRAVIGSRYKALSNTKRLRPVAKYHQEGTSRMPARPVVLGNKFLDEKSVDAITEHMFRAWP